MTTTTTPPPPVEAGQRMVLPPAPHCAPWCTAEHEHHTWDWLNTPDNGVFVDGSQSCRREVAEFVDADNNRFTVLTGRYAWATEYADGRTDNGIGDPYVVLAGVQMSGAQARAVAAALITAADIVAPLPVVASFARRTAGLEAWISEFPVGARTLTPGQVLELRAFLPNLEYSAAVGFYAEAADLLLAAHHQRTWPQPLDQRAEMALADTIGRFREVLDTAVRADIAAGIQ